MSAKLIPFPVASVNWQDYRASSTGMVVYYTSDPVSEMAIREIPEEVDSPVVPEPHYETGTYGLYSCARPKVRTAFVKNKLRYLFFVTKYAGTNADYRDKYMMTGYYHVCSIADARRYHIRYCSDYECLDVGTCTALRADLVHFVALEEAFEITEEVLKGWDYGARITRQTRIILDPERTNELLEKIRDKENVVDDYIEETKRLLPHGFEDDDEELEDEEPSEPSASDEAAEAGRVVVDSAKESVVDMTSATVALSFDDLNKLGEDGAEKKPEESADSGQTEQ